RLRTQHLLLWQARRAWEDHWFAEDDYADAVPYYRDTGQRYLKDVRSQLVEAMGTKLTPQGKQARLDSMTGMVDLCKQPGELAVVGSPRRTDFTGEGNINLQYQLGKRGNLPPGNPVAWMKTPDSALELKAPVGRQVLATTEPKDPLTFTLAPQ